MNQNYIPIFLKVLRVEAKEDLKENKEADGTGNSKFSEKETTNYSESDNIEVRNKSNTSLVILSISSQAFTCCQWPLTG